MRLGTCIFEDKNYVFFEYEESIFLPALDPQFDQNFYHDMLEFIQQSVSFNTAWLTEKTQVNREDVTFLAPIPRPAKNIMCLGLNYTEHVNETAGHVGREGKTPDAPIVFTKAVTSVIGADQVIPYDETVSTQLDWEAELGVIIGKGGKAISKENAMEHVFGYTIINDISARDLQFAHKQFFIGKSVDGGCPIGPVIVTADEIEDPQNLDLKCRVNGEIKQDSNTSMMIFDIADIITTLSKSMTLEAGDIIATGTPSGVGFVREPAEFLTPGDVVECEIEAIGVLRNSVK